MKVRFKELGFAVVVCLLTVAFIIPSSTSATVPGTNTLVSVDSSGNQTNSPTFASNGISGAGRYIVFVSQATNLVSGDTNGVTDVFVRDTNGGTTTRVSASSVGTQANGSSGNARISYDGRYVVFGSTATNLVSGDTNSTDDIFLHDNQTGTTTLVSQNVSGTIANGASQYPDVSADGRFVVFMSSASNLVSGINPSGVGDQIFLKDMQTGAVKVVSVNSSGMQGNATSNMPRISCSGNVVVFVSGATNLVTGDTNAKNDVFMRVIGWSGDQITDVTLGADWHSSSPMVSCNGNAVVYSSGATNLVPGTTAGIFEYNRLTQQNVVASITSSGGTANDGVNPTVSDDGRYVVFRADSLLDSYGGNTSGGNVYIRDTKAGTTQVISRNATYAVGWSDFPSISADGSYVSFYNGESWSSNFGKLLSSDTNNYYDIYKSETGF